MARRTISTKQQQHSIAIVVAMLLIASMVFVMRPAPEQVVVSSSDQVMQLEGVTRASDPIVLERLGGVDVDVSGVVSPVYEVLLSGDGRLEEVDVTVSYDALAQEGVRIQDAALYVFDRSELTWRMVPTWFDLDAQTLTSRIPVLESTLLVVARR